MAAVAVRSSSVSFEAHLTCIDIILRRYTHVSDPGLQNIPFRANPRSSPTSRWRQWVILELLDEIQERSSRSADLDIVLTVFEHIASRPLLRQQGRKRIPWHRIGRFPRCTIGEVLLRNKVNLWWSSVDSFQSGDEILSCRRKLDQGCDFRLSDFGISRRRSDLSDFLGDVLKRAWTGLSLGPYMKGVTTHLIGYWMLSIVSVMVPVFLRILGSTKPKVRA